jgi:carboxymethylenebutenolidase
MEAERVRAPTQQGARRSAPSLKATTAAIGEVHRSKIRPVTDEAPTHVARARTHPPGAPVLLLHAWWGLNQPIKDFADRLAGEGFTVLAPDLFDGTVLTTIEEADAHGQKMDSEYERILSRVQAALDELLAHPDARGERAAIIAFSFCGWYGAQVAEARPEVTALVSIYSDVFNGPDGTAYLGHFAENDDFVDTSQVTDEAHIYPGTKHWFMESDRPEYDADAAELAYARTVEFLRRQLV